MLLVQVCLTLLLSSAFTHASLQQTFVSEEHKHRTTSLIRDILKSNEIIPDVLDDFEPSHTIQILYLPTKNHPGSYVELGNDIPVETTSERPIFHFESLQSATPALAENDVVMAHQKPNHKTYTLILTDPDALSRSNPVKSEMCHWIITNITNSKTRFALDLDSGLDFLRLHPSNKKKHKNHEGELESYYPPAPPPKTGPHRYVFVLLEGSGGKHGIKKPKERPHWGYGKQRHGVRDWAEENSLKIVGANFFYAQNKKQ